MRHKILINCSNLHAGGGVAVASSFIDCLSHMNFEEFEIHLLLSSPVHRNLNDMRTNTSVFSSCIVTDFFGPAALWKGLDRHFLHIDLVFTVFGPAYFLFPRTLHVFGFAQPNIIYPNNPIAVQSNFLNRILTKVKYKIQEYFFSRANAIIVELEHVETRLKKLPLFKRIPVHVVYSSVHSIYKEHKKWMPITLPKISPNLKLGVISRNYPHKNLAILSEVKVCLCQMYNLKVDFYVTFQSDEWSKCDDYFRLNIVNVGGLSLSQCPSFYSAMDGVIFPSLLECFSAVPIETMMIKKPLFASNLSFIHDICGDHCNYFNPLDASDIARVVHEYFNLPVAQQKDRTNLAYQFVQKYPGPFERSKSYMSIIKETLTRLNP
jgi:glycosyltransferase involved in cell wall biosynthesis